MNLNNIFNSFASKTTKIAGSLWTFIICLFSIVVWIISGFFFHWSTTHALILNDISTIATLLMVFLIQNSQNRDSCALHLKIDALIKALKEVDNKYSRIENLNEQQLQEIKKEL